MKGSKIVEVFKDGNIVIPLYFLKRYKEFNVSMDEFICLMYLYNLGNMIVFDPKKFSNDLNMDLMSIMGYIDSLSEKKLIRVEVIKNEKGIMEETLILDDFYNKLSLITMDEVVSEENRNVEDSTIFEVIQKEFGRTLSPMEFEISKAWLDNGMDEDLIKEAIKEASFNGVSNLRYIDRILYEWGKNNIKTVQDVEKNRNKRRVEKEKIDDDVDLDIVDWNWFDEDE